MKYYLHIFFTLLSSVCLTSCSILKPAERISTSSYVLTATTPVNSPAKQQLPLTILIETPHASPAYNSTHMIYVEKPYELNFFARNNWAEPPTQMLQPLLVQSLQNTHRYKAVVAAPYSGSSDIRINSHLLLLQQEFFEHPSRVHIAIQIQIIRNSTQQLIASQRFENTEIATEDTPYGGVIAANAALSKLLQQIMQFCLVSIHN